MPATNRMRRASTPARKNARREYAYTPLGHPVWAIIYQLRAHDNDLAKTVFALRDDADAEDIDWAINYHKKNPDAIEYVLRAQRADEE